MIYDFEYMKYVLEAGLRRETIHGRTFSEIVSMKITLRNRIQERNYTWKDFFGNRVYENRNQMLIFAINRRLNIHDFRKKHRMSSRYCSGKAMSSSSFDFYETPMPSVSFCLFAHPIRQPLSIYISVPPHANKQKNRRFFLCVRMPRWNTVRFSDDHRARPGNFYWRTG